MRAVIATKTGEAPDPMFDRAAHPEPNAIERLVSRLEQFRWLMTRSEKRAADDRAMVTITTTQRRPPTGKWWRFRRCGTEPRSGSNLA